MDVVITDIDMPYMNGLTLAKEIKKVSNIPIIFLSAFANENSDYATYSDVMLEKPVLGNALLLAIQNILPDK